MPTYTPKMGLILPTHGESAEIDDINANMLTIDTNQGLSAFTSTTKPTSPYVGQTIFESDTNTIKFWNGTRWCVMPYRYGAQNIFTPESGAGTFAASTRIQLVNMVTATAPFDRLVTINNYAAGTIGATSVWRVIVNWCDPGDTNNPSGSTTISSQTINNVTAVSVGWSTAINTHVLLPANTGKYVRIWLEKISGGSISLVDLAGIATEVQWQEVDDLNRWNTYTGAIS